jgi:hypothetical protein
MAAAGMGGGEYDESIQGDNLLPTETPAVQARVFPTDTPSALAQGLPMDPPPSETPASEGLTILPPNQAPEPSQVKAYDQPKLDFSQLLKPAEILLAAIALLSALGAFIFFWKNRA